MATKAEKRCPVQMALGRGCIYITAIVLMRIVRRRRMVLFDCLRKGLSGLQILLNKPVRPEGPFEFVVGPMVVT